MRQCVSTFHKYPGCSELVLLEEVRERADNSSIDFKRGPTIHFPLVDGKGRGEVVGHSGVDSAFLFSKTNTLIKPHFQLQMQSKVKIAVQHRLKTTYSRFQYEGDVKACGQ